MDSSDEQVAGADPSITLPAPTQPDKTSEIATVAPRQTVVAIEQTLRPIDRCGARIKDRPGEFCAEAPMESRRRCRIHGGLTPVGRRSPHFVHGRDSRYPVPLTEHEQTRYEQYMRAVFDPARHDLASDLAIARIQRDRAVAAGDAGVTEAGAVARLAQVHAQITKGQTIRLELVGSGLVGAEGSDTITKCIEITASNGLGFERRRANVLAVSDESAHETQSNPAVELATLLPGDEEPAKTAYRLYLRGMDIETIADQLGLPEAAVATWVAERAARDSAPADTLRLLKRRLFASLDDAEVRDEDSILPALASAIAEWSSSRRTRPVSKRFGAWAAPGASPPPPGRLISGASRAAMLDRSHEREHRRRRVHEDQPNHGARGQPPQSAAEFVLSDCHVPPGCIDIDAEHACE